MTARFVCEAGLLQGQELNFEEGEEWIIGRNPDEVDIVVEDPRTSRRHALFKRTADGFTLENLSPTNPILLNEQPLEQETLLQEGDRIKMGSGTFCFTTQIAIPAEAEVPALQAPAKSEGDIHYDTIFHEVEDSFEGSFPSSGETPQPMGPFAGAAVPGNAGGAFDFNLIESSRWILKIMGGANMGAEFALMEGNEYLIGTDAKDCDVVLHDLSVSRRHAKLKISEEGELHIEDLESRNGVRIEGGLIEGGSDLKPHQLVNLGTTTLLVIDREGDHETIISDAMPSAASAGPAPEGGLEPELKEAVDEAVKSAVPGIRSSDNPFIRKVFIGVIAVILLFLAAGTKSLFEEKDIIVSTVNLTTNVQDALKDFPDVRFTYNKASGKLLLIGHVLTSVEKSQLLYNLQTIPGLKSVDDTNIVIDEGVWREMNEILSKNPSWKGVTMQAPRAGQFVMTGYLKTKLESEALSDYINLNFAYLDLLENRVIVEEELFEEVSVNLVEAGLVEIGVSLVDGELTLSGFVSSIQTPLLYTVIRQLQQIPGIRVVKNFVVELAPPPPPPEPVPEEDEELKEVVEQVEEYNEETGEIEVVEKVVKKVVPLPQQPEVPQTINITDTYRVTGTGKRSEVNVSVIINGRVYSRGDRLDGMVITGIRSEVVLLERDGIKFRIDINN